MADARGTWPGGYVRTEHDGSRIFYIRRQIDGQRYDFSTRTTTLKAAMQHLERFEADPSRYVDARDPSQRLMMTPELVRAFLMWSRDEKHNSKSWVYQQRWYLAWWADRLAGKDLKRVSLTAHLLPALDGQPGRQRRIAVLKCFYSWLRTRRHALKPHEDPTLKTLTVPQARPEQWRRVKSISREDFLKVRMHLYGKWRDAADVQAGTGWHVTELARFVCGGDTEPYLKPSADIGGVLICPQTKAGSPLKTAVSPVVAEAAKRLLATGVFHIGNYVRAVKRACDAAGVKRFGPGQFRHAVATWAINEGADPALVASFLNHKSAATTRRFYATHAVPTKVPTLL